MKPTPQQKTPLPIRGWKRENGVFTKIIVQLSDGSNLACVPEVKLPAPVFTDYIGKHEKRAGGKRHG